MDVDVEWPSAFRGPMRESEARYVGKRSGDDFGLAYLYAALIAEHELSDGRGGERLHEAAEAFCDALLYRAERDREP